MAAIVMMPMVTKMTTATPHMMGRTLTVPLALMVFVWTPRLQTSRSDDDADDGDNDEEEEEDGSDYDDRVDGIRRAGATVESFAREEIHGDRYEKEE